MSIITNGTAIEDGAALAAARSRRDVLVTFGVLFAAYLLAYAPVLRVLAHQWATNDTYSFGVLVPFISAYLIWLRRDRLHATVLRPRLGAGLIVVAFAGFLLVVGRMTAIVGIQEVSLILMLVGLIVLVLGVSILRELWFPLAYLLLMLPIWDVLTDRLHRRSQLFSAALADQLLRAVGIPVHREDVFLAIPNLTIEVASACSGVNFLIAVLMVGVPQAYLYLRGFVPRALVVGFAVAIAFLSNGLRVAIIAVLAHFQLSTSIHGPWHMLQGLFVSSIGFIVLFAGIWVLRSRYGRAASAPVAPPVRRMPRVPRRTLAIASGAAVLALAIAASVQPQISAGDFSVDESDALVSLGAPWRARTSRVPVRFLSSEGERQPLAQVFEAPNGRRLELYVASVAYQASGGTAYRSVELPRNTFASVVPVRVAGRLLHVNRATVSSHDGTVTDVVFWYDVRGGVTPERASAKAITAGELLIGRRPTPRLALVVSETFDRFASDDATMDAFVGAVVERLASSTRR